MNTPCLSKGMVALLMLATLLPLTHAVADTSWQLRTQKDNYQVYSRTVDGHVEVKATASVSATLGALLALLEDTDRGPEWIANCKRVVIEAAPTPYERRVHVYYNAPWPVRDRDMITYSIVSVDNDQQGYQIDIRDVGQNYSPAKQYVRMENVKGVWRVRATEHGKINITYQGSGRAAGSIPHWLSNNLLIDSTTATFANMVKLIDRNEYQVAGLLEYVH